MLVCPAILWSLDGFVSYWHICLMFLFRQRLLNREMFFALLLADVIALFLADVMPCFDVVDVTTTRQMLCLFFVVWQMLLPICLYLWQMLLPS